MSPLETNPVFKRPERLEFWNPIKGLSPQEAAVLYDTLGLNSQPPKPIGQLASEHNLQVRQVGIILQDAMFKLAIMYHEEILPKTGTKKSARIASDTEIPIWHSWPEELDLLKKEIESAEQSLARDENMQEGWRVLYRGLTSHMRNREGKIPEDIQELSSKVLDLFKRSYSEYSKKSERPNRRWGRGSIPDYEKQDGLLSPRHVRLVIFRFGLSGVQLNIKQLSAMESLTNASNQLSQALWKMSVDLVPFVYKPDRAYYR